MASGMRTTSLAIIKCQPLFQIQSLQQKPIPIYFGGCVSDSDSCQTFNYKNKETTPKLFHSGKTNKDKDLKSVIEEGTDINAIDSEGYTALNRAITTFCLEVVEILIAGGAKVYTNKKNEINYYVIFNIISLASKYKEIYYQESQDFYDVAQAHRVSQAKNIFLILLNNLEIHELEYTRKHFGRAGVSAFENEINKKIDNVKFAQNRYNDVKIGKIGKPTLHLLINLELTSKLPGALRNLVEEYVEYPATFLQAEKYLQSFLLVVEEVENA